MRFPRRTTRPGALGLAAACISAAWACTENRLPTGVAPRTSVSAEDVAFVDHSVTPALVKDVLAGVGVTTLISSDDSLPGSPRFLFGGSVDGMGLIRNAGGTFTLIANHEDNYAVSRLALDSTFRPSAGQYIVNSDNGVWRLCSATLATVAEHGFGPIFLTAGESGNESMTRAVDPFGAPNTSVPVAGFGRWTAENAVPLPAAAFPGKTVVVIGDDDSGANGGQVAVYISNTVGDLANGNLYVLSRGPDATRETRMRAGVVYPVTLKQIANQTTLTGAQIDLRARQLGAIAFGRVEDVDYRRGSAAANREVFFAVTGQNNTGANADYSRSKYGRIYKFTLNAADPTRGTLEVILDGDNRSGIAREFQNPDNVVATNNYLYIQEDPNGYGDETHDARVYQYNLQTRQLRTLLELDHRRNAPDAAKYNVGGPSPLGSWEGSGMLDVSEETGVPGTFILGIQAHTWRGAKYVNPDGGSVRPNENQASQVLVLTNLPR